MTPRRTFTPLIPKKDLSVVPAPAMCPCCLLALRKTYQRIRVTRRRGSILVARTLWVCDACKLSVRLARWPRWAL